MKLVVGLGNPGRKYDGTRHNLGFEVLRELARRHGDGKPKQKFDGEIVEARIGDERTLLLCPLTYMNRSGSSVGKAREFYKLDDGDLLIVCDDFNLPLGRLRVRSKGSAGGQKGLADIIRCLGSDQLARLRIGIGPVPEGWDPVDFVLGRFARDEGAVAAETVGRAADAAECWIREGTAACMNRYNAADD